MTFQTLIQEARRHRRRERIRRILRLPRSLARWLLYVAYDGSDRYFFLAAVFEGQRDLVIECGFREIGHGFWFLSGWRYQGPIAGMTSCQAESWLLRHGVAGQIFTGRMWGATPD